MSRLTETDKTEPEKEETPLITPTSVGLCIMIGLVAYVLCQAFRYING